MTATTSSPAGKASPLLWVGLIGIALIFLLLAFASRNDPNLGGFADPDGVGPDGLLAARLFVEELGGETQRNVYVPGADIDVAMLAIPDRGQPFGTEDDEDVSQSWKPLLDWVRNGGILITSIDVPGGPSGGVAFVEDESGDLRVPQGECTIAELADATEVRPLDHNPVDIDSGDRSCFGDDDEAIVVVGELGAGQVVRVATMGLFFNRSFDEADNAAVFARLIRIDDEPTMGFLPEAPVWFVVDEDGEHEIEQPQPSDVEVEDVGSDDIINARPVNEGDAGGPVDGEGRRVGDGDKGLLELIPREVLAFMAGLAISAAIYAIAKARRLGSPVIEDVPIELPSSSYVDAVGRLYRRAESASDRSSQILRHDLRTDLARRVGMSADSSAHDLATALVASDQQANVVALLEGPPPQSDDEFVALATRLIETRDRVERGGVTVLAPGDDISLDSVTERTPR